MSAPVVNVNTASIIGAMKSKRGKKSSADRVAAAETAFKKANLNNDEYAVILSMIKRLPCSSVADANKQYTENKRLGNENAKQIAGDANLDLTRPRLTQEAEFKVYIAVLAKIFTVNPGLQLSWGVITQLSTFQGIGKELDIEFAKVAPNLRDIMMKKAFPNLANSVSFVAVSRIRLAFLIDCLNWLKANGADFEEVNVGHKYPNGKTALVKHLTIRTLPSTIPKKVEIGTKE